MTYSAPRAHFRLLIFTVLYISGFTVNSLAQNAAALPSFAEPAISLDKSEIAFASGGDLWTVSTTGGEARLLVSHPATESRPIWSPDGKKLAFISTRTGSGDIYILTLASGELRRLTFDDVNDQLDGWSRDGRWIYFSSASRDIAGMNDVYRVSADGGTPMQVCGDRYASEYFSAPSPDGATLAITARGISFGQWWRKGHSHIDEAEILLVREGATPSYQRLTEGGAKEMWPMWSSDGRTIYYVSDRSGAQNIWSRPTTGGTARQITRFTNGRVLWPGISADGRTIVFERNFGIWSLDTANGKTAEIPITRRGAAAGAAVEHLTLTSNLSDLALSPDGKKMAFIARGEIFAASSKDGGEAFRVTRSDAGESQITWSADSKRIVYVSDRDGLPHLFAYDFSTNQEMQLTSGNEADAQPRFSPDGKLIAFTRSGKELRVIDPETKQERALAVGYLERAPFLSDRSFVWSPDSKWIAYAAVSNKSFSNLYAVPAAGGEAKQISFLASRSGNAVAWNPDGTAIFFTTVQRTESGQVARIDLLPRTPKFREDQFRDLFRQETPRTLPAERRTSAPPAAGDKPEEKKDEKKDDKKPVEIAFDNIRHRLSLLPVGVDVNSLSLSPDGKQLLLTASAEGQFNLYTYSLDELSREPAVARQLTSTPGFKGDAQFSPDGKEIFYLENGRINVISLETRQPRPVNVSAEMDVDFHREKNEVFRQAWSYLRDFFYDDKYHGADWNAVRTEFAPRIAAAGTPDEMRRLMNLMVGELNASHLGVSAGQGSAPPSPVGKLGLRFDRREFENNGRLKITEIIALSPAAVSREIKTGQYLTAIEGASINARSNLDELLAFRVSKRTALTISPNADGTNAREVVVRPVATFAEKALLYRQWVEQRREYVAKISNGRLGYVHMPDMSANSLTQLYTDLDADNHSREGVVIDVRNNNGGFVNVYAIDAFARRGYLTMTPRGNPAAPGRVFLGQRALEASTILVTNQHSLSDAEDFTEGYRALKLGKVVGEPTAGWIIYTSNVPLIDGSSVRIPFIKVQANDGTVMELNPRPVDIAVKRPIGESYSDKDSQLDAAVRELLKQPGTASAGGNSGNTSSNEQNRKRD
jgi:Tol biopolymer transport system component/C-terminal processing protease CtpA/Prc